MATEAILNGFDPIISANCHAVVMGSFPGKASLRAGHYYAHPRNMFWSVIGDFLDEPVLEWAFEDRYHRLNELGIGLWDVIAHCQRPGSLDSKIRLAEPVQLAQLRELAPNLSIALLNGRKAQQEARRAEWNGSIRLVDLPSTSPANASIPRDQKQRAWLEALRAAIR